jgi:hypothetical protein
MSVGRPVRGRLVGRGDGRTSSLVRVDEDHLLVAVSVGGGDVGGGAHFGEREGWVWVGLEIS